MLLRRTSKILNSVFFYLITLLKFDHHFETVCRFRRPVRCILDRDEDMLITGTRHPFLCKYKAGFKSNGKITSIKLDMFSNAGNTVECSPFVMKKALFQADNAYKFENVEFNGYSCKTDLPSNTAFRGFGGPQAAMFGENVLTQVAHELRLDPVVVSYKTISLFRV